MAPGSVSGKYGRGGQAARSPRAHDASNDGMHDSPGGLYAPRFMCWLGLLGLEQAEKTFLERCGGWCSLAEGDFPWRDVGDSVASLLGWGGAGGAGGKGVTID